MKAEENLEHILKIQKETPELLLCGSAALILSGGMPDRDMHDIDFVCNKRDLKNVKYDYFEEQYFQQNPHDSYNSYVFYYGVPTTDSGSIFTLFAPMLRINLLVFEDDVDIRKSQILRDDGTVINTQNLDDITMWKMKYNREKDRKDLETITAKAIEDAVFKGEK